MDTPRPAIGSPVMSALVDLMRPLSGGTSPAMVRSVVVLPTARGAEEDEELPGGHIE